MGAHLIEGEFQSDKYPTTPRVRATPMWRIRGRTSPRVGSRTRTTRRPTLCRRWARVPTVRLRVRSRKGSRLVRPARR